MLLRSVEIASAELFDSNRNFLRNHCLVMWYTSVVAQHHLQGVFARWQREPGFGLAASKMLDIVSDRFYMIKKYACGVCQNSLQPVIRRHG